MRKRERRVPTTTTGFGDTTCTALYEGAAINFAPTGRPGGPPQRHLMPHLDHSGARSGGLDLRWVLTGVPGNCLVSEHTNSSSHVSIVCTKGQQ